MQKTTNYQLNQWDAADPIRREDFNADNAALDVSLFQVEKAARNNAYHVYNLLLQSYYDSKYTGYRRDLIFDGFMNEDGVGTLTDGLTVDTANRCLLLDGAGQGSVSHNYGNLIGAYVYAGYSLSYTFTTTGRGTLTTVRVYLEGTATLTVTDASGTVLASVQETGTGNETWFILSVPLTAGKNYTVTLKNNTSGNIVVKRADEYGDAFGCYLAITPAPITQGTLTAAAQVTGPWSRALAWVRYSGGTVGLSLGGAAMTAVESRETQTLQGVTCQENAFVLDQADGGPCAVELSLKTSSGKTLKVFNFGIVLL